MPEKSARQEKAGKPTAKAGAPPGKAHARAAQARKAGQAQTQAQKPKTAQTPKAAAESWQNRMPRKKTQAEEIDQLMEYIRHGGSLGLELEKRLEEMPGKYSVLLITKQDKYDLLIANLVKIFHKKKLEGIFVTLNKSAEDLAEMLQANKVETSSLHVIDAISKSGKQVPSLKETYYVDSPQDLTEIQAQINDYTAEIPKEKRYLVLDSLTTLLIYNAEKTVEKFVHSINENLKAESFKSVFTIMEGTKPEIMNTMSQFFDKVIKPNPQINP